MLNDLDPNILIAAVLLGIGLMALAISILISSSKKDKALRRIDQLVRQRRQTQQVRVSSSDFETQTIAGKLDRLGEKIKHTALFNMFAEDEDKKLLGKAGLGSESDLNRFVVIRLILSAVALIVWFGISRNYDTTTKMIQLVGLFGLGFMTPKWLLRVYATNQEAAFEKELVALVDVMRLLQGVGLSVEQSLEVIAGQLKDLVPITGKLLYKARGQVKSGVSWNKILHKMTETYTSPEFKSFVAVISQIEKYGGAVQEPLRQFSERLVERERASVKETIGKLTVKITGIMVVTMMPALLIVAGGPGMISISRAF